MKGYTRLKRIFQKVGFIKTSKPIPKFYTQEIFSNKPFQIGQKTYGFPRVMFANKSANLVIGSYCSISEGVTIFLGGNHRPDWITTYPFGSLHKYYPDDKNIEGHPSTKGDVTIGNDVWIGYGATILSGVSVGNGAILGAHSVLTKNIGDYEIWAGNPAKFIKKRFHDDQIKALTKIQWWNWNDNKVKESILDLCSNGIDEFIKNNYVE
ncbi:CatB-related O-acetyltransferase [Nonlabens antarcticus]|uniref:CatB-related O-acetyltransferase n=1 Tax=Nonlabens antarcticus TaxID=392714 RepID=UPI0018914F35|nr:CatB-related O-acetyltransferase [Nonlabens antarcticus]